MHPDYPKKPEGRIDKYLANKDLLEDILLQLKKDLGVGDYFPKGEVFNYDGLISQLAAILEDLDRQSRLPSVLYLIDLPETLHGKPVKWENYEALAVLVLDREFKKVWFRKWHKKYK